MGSIAENLEKWFRAWIEKLYGVSESNICYIHGCRRKKKEHPKEKLVLGHKLGVSEREYDLIRGLKRKRSYRSWVIDVAQEGVVRLLSEYDEKLAKDSQFVISVHRKFFEEISDVENVVVIGHSISSVDWDYFLEVAKNASNAHWYFGCHGMHDLENVLHLADALGIAPIVFRTDVISVTKILESVKVSYVHKPAPKKIKSPDRNWNVQWLGKKISIMGSNSQINRVLWENIKRCLFAPSSNIILLVINGLDAGLPFFRLVDGAWVYIGEMEPIPNQNLINRRLQHVYLNGEKSTFVYNNRVREYSLKTGLPVQNQARRNAKSGHYAGEEISKLFLIR